MLPLSRETAKAGARGIAATLLVAARLPSASQPRSLRCRVCCYTFAHALCNLYDHRIGAHVVRAFANGTLLAAGLAGLPPADRLLVHQLPLSRPVLYRRGVRAERIPIFRLKSNAMAAHWLIMWAACWRRRSRSRWSLGIHSDRR